MKKLYTGSQIGEILRPVFREHNVKKLFFSVHMQRAAQVKTAI